VRAPLLIIILLGLVYGLTLAPGITWANHGADSGGLVVAAYTGGAAHPPGYPLYLSLARLAQLAFPGEMAFRTNLLSALFAILAALGLYALLRQLKVPTPLAGLGALSLGLAPAVWGQAVISEVYTLHLALASLVFLQLFWVGGMSRPGTETVSDALRGLVFGLALGNHATSLFLAPVLLFDSTPGQRHPHQRVLLRFGVAGLTALGLYATLFLRGLGDAPVNWGKVNSFERLWWLVSGAPYRNYLGGLPDLPQKLPLLWAELAAFGWPLLVLAGLALACLPGLKLLKRLTLLIAALHLFFALNYDTRDWQVNLLPLYLLLGLWLALGLVRLPDFLHPAWQKPVRWGLSALAALSLAWNVAVAWPQVDASRDTRAADFAETILTGVSPNALVFTNEDRDTFALWYAHYVLGQRPDVAVLVSDLLPYDWYRETLRLTYPHLVIPDSAEDNFRQAVMRANPDLPACAIFIDPVPAFGCR
jgi:hypothetical protein